MSVVGLWKKYPFWCRFAVWIGLPAALAAGWIYCVLRGSLPTVSGTVALAGLHDGVTIHRDAQSIPDISARSDLDAYFALGFLHAQDRLWQMEMNRRIGAGRLSEVLGESAIGSDVAMLRIGLYANARKIWAHLGAVDRAALQSYVDGVNGGVRALDALPVEFQLLAYKPEPWKAEDSLVLMQLMAWQYSSNLAAEINRMLLIRHHGPAIAEMLMPGAPKDLIDTAAKAGSDEFAQRLEDGLKAGVFGSPQKLVGSNAWAVAGSHTASGAPLLANDPHLTTPIPSLWYLARIRGGALDVSGATMPGLPFVMIGKNRYIAWGMTNAMADTQDVVLEQINPLNKDQYLADGKYVNMEMVQAEVRVRSGFLRPPRKPERITIRRTRNGPLLSDLADPLGLTPFSVRWTGDDDLGGTFASFRSMNYAKNWEEFNQALAGFVAPVHVFTYADRQGNIGMVAPGLYPIRKAGNGSIPMQAKDGAPLWPAFIPYASVPRQFNPDDGIIVTANNKLVDGRYPYHISSDWSPPYRAARVRTELERMIRDTPRGLTARHMMLLQMDVVSPVLTNGVLDAMRALVPGNAAQKRALALLPGWNGKMSEDSQAATLVASWMSHLNYLALEKLHQRESRSRAGEDPLLAMRTADNATFMAALLRGEHGDLCARFRRAEGGPCAGLLSASLDRAIAELGGLLGSDERDWTWKRLHAIQFAHFPFSSARRAPTMPSVEDSIVAHIFDRSIVSAGGNDTVNVGPVSFDTQNKYQQFFGAMYREVIDLTEGADSYFTQGTGQSGNPASVHYDDLIAPHQRGHYLNMEKRAVVATLQLTPVAEK